MPAALIALALLGGALEIEPERGFGFDRVDLIAEDPGTWINYDLHYSGIFPTSTAVRFVTQVKVSWRTPVRGLYLGTSLSSISATLEAPLLLTERHGLFWTAGLQTRLFVPKGVTAGLAYRVGPVRVGAGVSVLSTASWSHLRWTQWSVLPTVGIGFGRSFSLPEDDE